MRGPAQTVLGLAILALASSLVGCGNTERSPHIFVFLVDTLRADHLGCYGYARATSPVLDEFATDAVVFRNAYTPSPWTRPAVASLFTGVPPAIHGVMARAGWAEPSLSTWAERLAERGYWTQALTANGNLERRYGLDQGFADYEYVHEEGRPYVSSPEMEELWKARLPSAEAPPEQPVFSYLHTMDPHIPYSPRREYVRPFILESVPWQSWFDGSEEEGEQIRVDVNRYDGEIRQTDAIFGRYLEELRGRGWYEDSWIVFVADHGEEFREHGRRGHGHALWEKLLRVPLVIRPPGGRGSATGQALVEMAEAQVPIHSVADLIASVQWEDWVPLAQENAAWTGMPAEILGHWVPRFPGEIPPVRRASFHLDGRSGWMVAEQTRKLIWNEFPTPGFLQIDLRSDPQEKHATAEPDADLLDELRAYFRACARGYDVESTRNQELVLRPVGEYRGAHLWPENLPGKVQLRRRDEKTTLDWTAAAGSRVLLVRDVDQTWEVSAGEGEWTELLEAAPTLGLRVREVGQPRAAAALPPPMSEELRKQLKALGYLQ